jgi:hypothetical protein
MKAKLGSNLKQMKHYWCELGVREPFELEMRRRQREEMGWVGPRGWVWGGCECVVVITFYFLHSKNYPSL